MKKMVVRTVFLYKLELGNCLEGGATRLCDKGMASVASVPMRF